MKQIINIKRTNKNPIKITITIILLLLFAGCSSTPTTTYRYTLHNDIKAPEGNPLNLSGGLGIGPIQLPESWRQKEIASWGNNNQILLDSRQLWAGDPKLAITRVLSADLSQRLQSGNIWSHPWDARTRPKQQIIIVIENFGGILGGEITLSAKWQILDDFGNKKIAHQSQTFTQTPTDASYSAYVTTLNQLINQFSDSLEKSVRMHLTID
jgi:uncharacterized protein